MNDIRRSILWVVFGFSMVLIWDKWQIHNGHQATFFPTAAVQTPAPAATKPTDASLPQALPATSEGGVPASAPAAGAPAPVAQRHEASTDVLELVFNSEGGALVGAKLRQHAQASGGSKTQDSQPFTLLTQTPDAVYVAQTGLIGGSFPNHKTPMTLLPGPLDRKSVV